MTDQSEANIDDAVAIELGEQPAPVDPVEPASPSTWNGVKIDSTSFPVIDVHKKQPKTVRKFYKRQNRTVEELKAIQDKINIQRERFRKRNAETQLEENAQEENKIEKEERLTKAQAAYEKLCLASSFWVNVILAIVKLGSSIVSLSLAVITSTFDSFLGSNDFISLTRADLLVGAILYMANRMRNTKSPTMHMHYPVGRARLEPLGFIVFASVMSTASLFLIIEGAKQIIEGIIYKSRGQDIPENILSLSTNPAVLTAFYWVGVAVLAFTIVLKFILWLLCRRATYSTSCQAYATDHFLDVITNLVALVAVFVTQWVWWFDPMGAILLSIYIVYRWSKESIPHIMNLVGRVADREFINLVTFIALNHNEAINYVDTVQAWYMGDGLYVELDIVMDTDTPLNIAHDIAEELQLTIEQMPEVERCYVHIDHEYDHKHKDEHLGY